MIAKNKKDVQAVVRFLRTQVRFAQWRLRVVTSELAFTDNEDLDDDRYFWERYEELCEDQIEYWTDPERLEGSKHDDNHVGTGAGGSS